MHNTVHIALAAVLVSATVALPLSDAYASPDQTSPAAVEEEASLVGASPVADGDLSESRGAFSSDLLNLNNSYLNANSSGNTSIGSVTGNNQINSGSFTNTQGLVNVIQNTGNNVVIQSSTIVNMTMIGK